MTHVKCIISANYTNSIIRNILTVGIADMKMFNRKDPIRLISKSFPTSNSIYWLTAERQSNSAYCEEAILTLVKLSMTNNPYFTD